MQRLLPSTFGCGISSDRHWAVVGSTKLALSKSLLSGEQRPIVLTRAASSLHMKANPEPEVVTISPGPLAGKNLLSPKKLLLTKWTAVKPRNREKHFVVTRVVEPEPPSMRVEQIELEAVHSKQVYLLHWRELTDASLWRQGWV